MALTRNQSVEDSLLLACLGIVEITETALVIYCTPHSVRMLTLQWPNTWNSFAQNRLLDVKPASVRAACATHMQPQIQQAT